MTEMGNVFTGLPGAVRSTGDTDITGFPPS